MWTELNHAIVHVNVWKGSQTMLRRRL